MATTTPNLNLTKPAASDFYDINVQNDNMDKIDAGALPKAAATAADQMLVSTGAGAWAVKTLAQIKTWLGLGSAAGKTVGAAQGNVPENAAALGTTDNAAVVTDATGKLKAHASGALKSAAFTESSAYATSAQGGKADGAIQKSLATAADQMLVSNGSGTWIAKALADVKTWLGLGSAAYTASSAYATAAQGGKADGAIQKSDATAADQMLVSSGSGTWIVKTLAQIKTWLSLGSAAYKTVGAALGNIPENAAALGTIDNAAVVTDATGKLKAHASGALKGAAFCDAEGAVTNDSSKVPTGAAVVALLGRSTPVTGNDTGYGTYMVRGTALSATESTPTYNGQICWMYE